MLDRNQKRILIGTRIAQELQDGDFVNLGIGIPTEVANHIPQGIKVYFHTDLTMSSI